MADLLTFLQLSPDFGGTKFGPFTGVEIRLGSDPTRNDIVLPEALGVAPEHVKVIKQGPTNFIIAPTQRTAAVFIYKASGGPPKQAVTPMAAQPGDSFAVVTAEGPRFYIVAEAPPKQTASAAAGRARNRLSFGSFVQEFQRQGFTAVLTTGPGQMAQRAFNYVISGAIFRPRNIIMLLTIGSGWMFGTFSGCRASGLSSSLATANEDLDECKDQIAFNEAGAGGSDGINLLELTDKVLGTKEGFWSYTLDQDTTLKDAFFQQLKTQQPIVQNRFAWMYRQGGTEFAKARGTMQSKWTDQIPPELERVLAFAMAAPREREWTMIKDSSGRETCARGPFHLTYRQAKAMGIEAQLDYYAEPSDVDAEIEKQKSLLLKTAERAGEVGREFDGEVVTSEGAQLQGAYACLHIEGDDERTNSSKYLGGIARYAGASAQKVPAVGDPNWIAARVAKFYSADFDRGFDQIDYRKVLPSNGLKSTEVTEQGDWAVEKVAQAMARSALISCAAVLDKQAADSSHMGQAPSLIDCAVLGAMIEYEQF